MLVRRRTSDAFFIGAAPRPRYRQAREAIARLLQEEGGLHHLRMMLAEVMPAGKAEQMPPEDVVATLADGVAAGRFVLIGFRPRPVWSPTFAEEGPPAGEQAPPPEEKKEEEDWLEIELMDDGDPPQPIAGARYVVELKDGTLVEGSLDDKGKARVEGIKKGSTSKVSFPDIDAKEWK
jgi:hypothetical protein